MTANDITVIKVIESKLPSSIFNAVDAGQVAIMAVIINDVFVEMETCLAKRFYLDENKIKQVDWERVGDESNYDPIQKSIIGDFSAWRFLVRNLTEMSYSIGQSISSGSGGKFVKNAKAGSTNVEFDERDVRNNPFFLKMSDLAYQLKQDVMRKARNIGCIIDINDDNIYKIELEHSFVELPIMYINDRNNEHSFFF